MDLQTRLELVLKAVGANAIIKDLKRVKAELTTLPVLAGKYGLPGQGTKGGKDAQVLQLGALAKEKKLIKKNFQEKIKDNNAFMKNLEANDKTINAKKTAHLKSNLDAESHLQEKAAKDSMSSKIKDNNAFMKNLGASKTKDLQQEDKFNQKKTKALQARLDHDSGAIKKAQQANYKQATRFKGEYMGIMFAGMQLQRVFGGLFSSMVKDYKELTKESVTPLSSALTRLEANWKFLKFSMLEAATPALKFLSEAFANMLGGISKMNPATLTLLTGLIGSLAVIGGMAATFGQAALLFSSISSARHMAEATRAMNAAAGIKAAPFNAGTAFLTKLGAMGAITFSIVEAVDAFDQFKKGDYWDSLMSAIQSGVGLTAGMALLKGNVGVGLPLIGIVIGLKLAEEGVLFKALGGLMGAIAGVGAVAGLLLGKTLFRAFLDVVTLGQAEKEGFMEKWFDKDIQDLYSFDHDLLQTQMKQAFGAGFNPLYELGVKADEQMEKFITDAKEGMDSYSKDALDPAISKIKILNEEESSTLYKSIYVDIYERHHISGKSSSRSEDYKSEWGERAAETLKKIQNNRINEATPQ